MKYQAILADTFGSIDIDVEILMLLCSLVLFYILHKARHPHMIERKRKTADGICAAAAQSKAHIGTDASESTAREQVTTSKRDAEAVQARHAEIEKSLHDAFDAEDYWQVLKCWGAIKWFGQCPPVYLSQAVKAMQCCNKDNRAIVAEIRDFLKWHPQKRNTGLVDDILESLARQHENAQLVEWIVSMLPRVKLAKNSRTYEILLRMHVATGNHAKAQEVVSEMKERKVELTPCGRVAVLTLALQLDNVDMVLKNLSRLKTSWDVRSTWAVSPFALQRHKESILKQIVELAHKQEKLSQLQAILQDMSVPQDIVNAVRADCKTSAFAGSWRKPSEASDEASTSEGSRSDSEEEASIGPCFRPPPGLATPCF